MNNHAENKLDQLLSCLSTTHGDEMDCKSCDEQLDKVIDKVAEGVELSELLPLVAQHFECCKDCREEYEALLSVLIAENSGTLPLIAEE
ncbi:MAG: hypothetical protein D6737_02190 [Chloroflexi bacterium]|nr:MAG: hypothetical protein D6737_02190 [Chloroflexota bacterium]